MVTDSLAKSSVDHDHDHVRLFLRARPSTHAAQVFLDDLQEYARLGWHGLV